ncbi:hypothetical protein HF325_004882 [Metschnikowia pulcherrima]|uniref:GOLD domain-containing protein n=1 Tax=Metschnikowia pulcherrima TaxID=27326 RepID=A0A8H7LAR9_9ASCO|nr:hypothetical protein HF325_004882 [Metschnikowia pulcherrima]
MQISVLAIFVWAAHVSALHFYLQTGQTRCFYEDLPSDALVVGKLDAYEYDERMDDYMKNDNLKLKITVDETFDNDHPVISFFNSHDSGEHKFCLTPLYIDGTHSKKHRIFFDVAIGAALEYVDLKSSKKVDGLTLQIQDLNRKLQEIHQEQESIRERESIFRNQSELTNARVVWWSIIQVAVLVGTCAYQLRHLKGFFVKQKIV